MVDAPEPRKGTAPRPPIGRPFQKGHSGNPGGRPKGVASRVRELLEKSTEDGSVDAWEWLDNVRRGVIKGFGARERLEATKILLDRAYGRTPETVLNLNADVTGTEGAELATDALADLSEALALPATVDGQLVGGTVGGMPSAIPSELLANDTDTESEGGPER